MRLFGARTLLFAALGCTFAEPIARPEAAPQVLTNNAPFSGAIYIVNSNGEQIAGNGYCPASASVSCSSVNEPSWCCPANYACAVPANSNGLIGCCPAGSTCAGSVNAAQVYTVTVSSHQQTPAPNSLPQTTVFVQPNPVFVSYCETLTMHGPGLPKEAQGTCGTILIVNEGIPSLKTFSFGFGMVIALLHVALGRMFNLP